MASGKEVVGDEDIPRALIAACKDTYEVVHRVYDRLLATGGAVLHHHICGFGYSVQHLL